MFLWAAARCHGAGGAGGQGAPAPSGTRGAVMTRAGLLWRAFHSLPAVLAAQDKLPRLTAAPHGYQEKCSGPASSRENTSWKL